MKMISNDLRSSCRALLIGEHQGGGKRVDPIFHDILDNSDVVLTIPVDDTYKITVNLWVSGRLDVYGSGDPETQYVAAAISEGEGYCQNYSYCKEKAHAVFIIWRGDEALYAVLSGTYSYLPTTYYCTDVHGSNDTYMPCVYYAYQSVKSEYVRGSAVLTSNIARYEWKFMDEPHGTKSFKNYVYFYDSSDKQTSLYLNYTTKNYVYKLVRPQCEWTNPETGETSIINDATKIPTVSIDRSYESVQGLSLSSSAVFYPQYGGTYSDFGSDREVMDAYDELVGAICRANGTDFIRAELILPESEESI